MKHQTGRVWALTILVFVVSVQLPVSAAQASTVDNWRQKWSQTTRQMSAVRGKLRTIKREQANAAHQLASSEKRLGAARVGLKDIQNQLGATRQKLNVTRVNLDKLKKSLNEREELLGSRLVDSYKHGSVGYLSVVLGAADFSDLLNRSHVVKKLVESDADLIQEIERDKAEIERHEAMLRDQERKRAELERAQTHLTRKQYTETQNRSQILKSITNERTKYEQMLAELEQNSKEIEAMIRRMEQTPEGKKRLAQVYKGNLLKPVNGRKTSDYGMRYHPIVKSNRMHTGVDLAAPTGTAIQASATGVVTFAGWYGAYGNCVIIDHGGGLSTLYGHMSRISVSKGAEVKQGQTIGAVGSTGWSTGPHLHFEVRKHGTPVRPPF